MFICTFNIRRADEESMLYIAEAVETRFMLALAVDVYFDFKHTICIRTFPRTSTGVDWGHSSKETGS